MNKKMQAKLALKKGELFTIHILLQKASLCAHTSSAVLQQCTALLAAATRRQLIPKRTFNGAIRTFPTKIVFSWLNLAKVALWVQIDHNNIHKCLGGGAQWPTVWEHFTINEFVMHYVSKCAS